jgi:hypothetical protein
VGEKLRVRSGVVEIGDGRADVAGAASTEVGCDGTELVCVAANEEKAIATRCPQATGGFSDARGGAQDKDALGTARHGLCIDLGRGVFALVAER